VAAIGYDDRHRLVLRARFPPTGAKSPLVPSSLAETTALLVRRLCESESPRPFQARVLGHGGFSPAAVSTTSAEAGVSLPLFRCVNQREQRTQQARLDTCPGSQNLCSCRFQCKRAFGLDYSQLTNNNLQMPATRGSGLPSVLVGRSRARRSSALPRLDLRPTQRLAQVGHRRIMWRKLIEPQD
jgi:hypothetical protein